MADLTPEQRAMLDYEHRHWRSAEAKDTEVQRLFGLDLDRYHRELNGLLDRPEALAYAPVTVRRLRRLRQRRLDRRRLGRESA